MEETKMKEMNYLNPMIVEEERGTRYSSDIYTRMLKDRQIFVVGEVTTDMSLSVVAQMLYLDSLNHEDITLVLNSPGGSCMEGMAMIDTMYNIQSKTNVICFGLAASMGSLLLTAATGKRQILPHGEVMIHNPSTQMSGQYLDLKNNMEHLERTRNTLFEIYQKKTKLTEKMLEDYLTKDWWMTAEEALKYGVVDEILHPVHKM